MDLISKSLLNLKMKKHLSIPGKMDDDGSDALSTATHNSGHGEHSPSHLHHHNYEETESLGDGSKKIRKKRNAYQKIEDDVRLKLLEAVQKHGETLKSAAKKYKINYSSAKSILHTYRKEGRILKKSAQERNVKRTYAGGGDMEVSPSRDEEESNMETVSHTHISQKAPHHSTSGRMEEVHDSKENIEDMKEANDMNQKATNQINGMMDNFASLLKLENKSTNESKGETTGKRQSHQAFTPKVSNKLNVKSGGTESVRNIQNKTTSIVSEEPQTNNVLPTGFSNLMSPVNLVNLANLSHLLQGNPGDRLKLLDNLYTNQSTSPLAATNTIPKDFTEASANTIGIFGKELENLADVVSSLQTQPKQNDEIFMPHPVRFNTAQLMQEKIESKLNNNNDDADWNGTIENAAIETFKSFMDAQLLLCDALKKASYLNNLMQMQKARPDASPTAAQGQTQDLQNP